MITIGESIRDWFGLETSEEALCGEVVLVDGVEGMLVEMEEVVPILEDMGRGNEK